jgi:hypothetical protein
MTLRTVRVDRLADWLDEIEAQLDASVPYYVPSLIAEIRRLRKQKQEAGRETEQSGQSDCRAGS